MENRTSRQCRERYINHLKSDIKSGPWSKEEEDILIEEHGRIGNQWSKIAKLLPGRAYNSVKNRWHSLNRCHKIHEPSFMPEPTAYAEHDTSYSDIAPLSYIESMTSLGPSSSTPKSKKIKTDKDAAAVNASLWIAPEGVIIEQAVEDSTNDKKQEQIPETVNQISTNKNSDGENINEIQEPIEDV